MHILSEFRLSRSVITAGFAASKHHLFSQSSFSWGLLPCEYLKFVRPFFESKPVNIEHKNWRNCLHDNLVAGARSACVMWKFRLCSRRDSKLIESQESDHAHSITAQWMVHWKVASFYGSPFWQKWAMDVTWSWCAFAYSDRGQRRRCDKSSDIGTGTNGADDGLQGRLLEEVQKRLIK
jgi:hypothetical protein